MNKGQLVVERQDQVAGHGCCKGQEQLMVRYEQDVARERVPAELLDLVLQHIDGEHKKGESDQGQ